jgi:hypothetical protein
MCAGAFAADRVIPVFPGVAARRDFLVNKIIEDVFLQIERKLGLIDFLSLEKCGNSARGEKL